MKKLLLMAAWLAAVCGTAAAAQETQTETGSFYLPKGNAAAGREDFIRTGCVACHRVAGDAALPAPASGAAAPTLTFGPAVPAGTIAQAIVAPSHSIAPDFGQGDPEDAQTSPMTDFADKLTIRELRDITAYLQSQQY